MQKKVLIISIFMCVFIVISGSLCVFYKKSERNAQSEDIFDVMGGYDPTNEITEISIISEEENVIDVSNEGTTGYETPESKQDSNTKSITPTTIPKAEITTVKQETKVSTSTEGVSKEDSNSNIKIEEQKPVEEVAEKPSNIETQEVAKVPVKEPNETKANMMKADIEEIAKRNPDLWDKDGKKLFKVKIDSLALDGNYFSPYRNNQLETKVLNSYSCTFVIYVIDYKLDGVVTETRYYIKIAQY